MGDLAVDGAAQHRTHKRGAAQEQDPTADYPEQHDRDERSGRAGCVGHLVWQPEGERATGDQAQPGADEEAAAGVLRLTCSMSGGEGDGDRDGGGGEEENEESEHVTANRRME